MTAKDTKDVKPDEAPRVVKVCTCAMRGPASCARPEHREYGGWSGHPHEAVIRSAG